MDLSEKTLADITAIRTRVRPVAPDHTVIVPVSIAAILIVIAAGFVSSAMQGVAAFAGLSDSGSSSSGYDSQARQLSAWQKDCLDAMPPGPAYFQERWARRCR